MMRLLDQLLACVFLYIIIWTYISKAISSNNFIKLLRFFIVIVLFSDDMFLNIFVYIYNLNSIVYILVDIKS